MGIAVILLDLTIGNDTIQVGDNLHETKLATGTAWHSWLHSLTGRTSQRTNLGGGMRGHGYCRSPEAAEDYGNGAGVVSVVGTNDC